MKFSEFNSTYLEISTINQKILYQLLRRLKHEKPHEELKDTDTERKNIRENLQKYRKEKGFSLSEICKIVKEETGMELTFDTLNSIIKRNTQNSQWNKPIADALGIKERVLFYGEKFQYEDLDQLITISSHLCDIKWLFESLSECNQDAILYLAKALLMSETAPEVFDDTEDYY